MSLAPEQMLDQYRLIEKIGEGGMGVVWKARDTTLDRDVAIKVLPAEFVRDTERLARFEREAKAVAALSHPNIVAIHGFGTSEGVAYAVNELLAGRSLREHLDEGPLPPRKSLDLARQIATGLDAAHARGIVHRDLKPDNVFVSPNGRARILDFGLAAVSVDAGGSGDSSVDGGESATELATRTSLTHPGAVMGTVGYMSPEQVRGEAADSRSDIFALGTMLHEMLTGRRPFERDTAAETMTAILREDPQEVVVGDKPAPPAVSRLLERCLEKAPDERFQSARDLAFALGNSTLGSGAALPAAEPTGRTARRGARIWAFVVLAAVIAFTAGRLWRGTPQVTEPPRVTQLTFTGDDYQPNVSADGRLIAFTSGRTGISQIWLRQVVGGGEQPLTEGPDWRPRFSPDGTSVTFIRSVGETYAAYRVPVVGGQPRKLIEHVTEVEWSPDGRRLAFLRGSAVADLEWGSQVGLLDPETGEERILKTMEGWDLFGLAWSPDGNRISMTKASIQGSAGDWRTLVLDSVSGETQEFDISGARGTVSGATWASPSTLILAISLGTVTGRTDPGRIVRFDLRTQRQQVLLWAPHLFPFRGSLNSTTQLGLIDDNSLVFDTFQQNQTLREISIDGEVDRELLGGFSIDRQPSYHPDGSRVLFTSNRAGNVDLFSYEFSTGKLLQLTDHPGSDWDGAYTPDGSSILWGSDRSGNLEIWIADLDGSNPRQITNDGLAAQNPTMTPDGQWIVYAASHPDHAGISRVRSDGTDAQQVVPGTWGNPEVSPDGRYALYVSTDAARLKNLVQVVELETGANKPFEVEISYNLRSQNVTYGRGRWMPDGSAIVYVGLDEQGRTGLWIQDFLPDRNTVETRRPLIGFHGDMNHESFGISPDGKRITLSTIEQVRTINLVDHLPNLR